ncbi:MAG: TolB family protein, partial [Anaerolineae bacterium]
DANTGALIRPQGTNHADDFRPFWSQGGTQIVYDSLHMGKGKFNLYTTVLDSRYDEFLFTGSMAIIGTSPVWMDDEWIAFSACDYWVPKERGGGSNCGIYRMPSWSGPPQLIKRGDLTMRATDSHASQLLFMSQESGNWEVYVTSTQGGEPRNLTASPGSQDGLATFSPDGKQVAFASNRGGVWAIWAVNLDGSGLIKLFDLPGIGVLTGDWTEERVSWGP